MSQALFCMLIGEINHLPDMMLKMGRASKERHESVTRGLHSYCAIFGPPGIRCLRLKRLDHQLNHFIKSSQDLFLRWRIVFCEFPIPITHISRPGDLRADVIIQVPYDMQRQMSKTIPVRIRLLPKFLFREFLRKSTDPLTEIAVGMDKTARNNAR